MKNIVCYDVETTGLSTKEDYIIQLAAVKFDRNFRQLDSYTTYVIPPHAYKIDARAEETHHITREIIESEGRPLKEVAQKFTKFCEGCDLLSYNGNRFDIKFIYKDFLLVGIEFPLDGRVFYDAMSIETVVNPRTLSVVYKNYTGDDARDAHNAFADVHMTMEVFKSQVIHHGLNLEELAQWKENQLVTPDGTIRDVSKNGEEPCLVFNIGKYRDTEFMKTCELDPGYIKWFMQNIASNYTIKKLREYYKINRNKDAKK